MPIAQTQNLMKHKGTYSPQNKNKGSLQHNQPFSVTNWIKKKSKFCIRKMASSTKPSAKTQIMLKYKRKSKLMLRSSLPHHIEHNNEENIYNHEGNRLNE